MINCFKIIAVFAFVSLISLTAKAQIGYDYAQYDLGIGLDLNTAYTDAQTKEVTKSGRFSFNYNVSPFVNYVFEFQTGNVKGGDTTTSTGRTFNNQFNAGMIRVQLQMGELLDYSQSPMANFFKNVYVSTGIGFISNHMTAINRYSYKIPGFYTGGEDNSNQLLIPARIGYEIKVFNKYNEPGFKIDIGYQYNYLFGDGLDGFDAGKQKDTYTQLSVGIKFAVGGVTSYRKQIHY